MSAKTERIGGATFQRDSAGRLSYSETDRFGHYSGLVRSDRCPVCLLGMASTHGRVDLLGGTK